VHAILPAGLCKIPLGYDDELPAGLTPMVDWQHWLGQLQERRGSGFAVNKLADNSMFAMFENRSLVFHLQASASHPAQQERRRERLLAVRFRPHLHGQEGGSLHVWAG